MWKITGRIAAAAGKLAAAALLISFLSIWTTGYVVNSYVETLLKQFHIPLDEKPFALSGLWGTMWGAHPEVKQAANGTTEGGEQGSQSTGGGSPAVGGAGSTTGSSDSTGASDKGQVSSDGSVDAFSQSTDGELSGIGGGTGPRGNSAATTGQGSGAGTGGSAGTGSGAGAGGNAGTGSGAGAGGSAGTGSEAGTGGSAGAGISGDASTSGAGGTTKTGAADDALNGVAMSPDQINAVKSTMSEADKQQLFSVMMKKLPQDAWQRISVLMEDGLTAEEMTEVKQLLAQYLNREEYDGMLSILSKY